MDLIQHKAEIHNFYVSVGDNIRFYRLQLNVTQEDLADGLSITRVSMTNIENGKQRLPLHLMSKLATLLDVPIDKFIKPINIPNILIDLEQAKKERKIRKLEDKIKVLKQQ